MTEIQRDTQLRRDSNQFMNVRHVMDAHCLEFGQGHEKIDASLRLTQRHDKNTLSEES